MRSGLLSEVPAGGVHDVLGVEGAEQFVASRFDLASDILLTSGELDGAFDAPGGDDFVVAHGDEWVGLDEVRRAVLQNLGDEALQVSAVIGGGDSFV